MALCGTSVRSVHPCIENGSGAASRSARSPALVSELFSGGFVIGCDARLRMRVSLESDTEASRDRPRPRIYEIVDATGREARVHVDFRIVTLVAGDVQQVVAGHINPRSLPGSRAATDPVQKR